MSLTILLTLGRLPKCLDLARAFKAAGARVLVAEPHRRHLTGGSRSVAKSFELPSPVSDKAAYLARLQQIIAAEQVDWVIPVSEECLFVSQLEPQAIAPARIWGMPFNVIEQLHDKSAFIELCQSLQLPAPATMNLGAEAADTFASHSAYVIKPRYSCAGRGVTLAAAGTALPRPAPQEDWLVQQLLPGNHRSSCSIVHRGVPLITVCYRPLLLSGTVAIAFERIETPRDMQHSIERIAAHYRYSGFLSFDFIDDAHGTPTLIECNPRATSGLHFIEPRVLAQAILEPQRFLQEQPTQLFRPQTRLQQFYPCLTETQTAMLRRDDFARKLKVLLRTPDATFAWRDPLPLLLMPYYAWPIMSAALFGDQSFGEAATHDIEWQA
ncbi:MAG: ATP-grasp domain-containing protein [Pseudomonadales bacterium]